MNELEVIQKLLQLDKRAVESVARFNKKRYLYRDIKNTPGKAFVGLIGPRGVGKTVLFRQLRNETSSGIYISTDTLESNADIKKSYKFSMSNLQ